ncbi:transcriptional regulator, GntR family [Lachnospiraceae bacterium KM106-2]|nr:transcriptional regulator, GntR family [Lachnospiraceae bacterium KM106-2]
MGLEPIKKAITLKEQAYLSIKQAIYSNTLQPGAPLVEEQLSSTLSISRTPIRSALQQLVYEKLAFADNTGHIYVSKITEKDIEDITIIRSNLEPLVIDLVTFPLPKDTITNLYDSYHKQLELFENEPDNNIRYAELDCEFHTLLANLSNNTLLVEMIEKMNNMMIRFNVLSGTLNSHKKNALEEHRMIIHYLETGKHEFAKAAILEHVKCVAQRIFSEEN